MSTLIGFSGTPRSISECQQYIDALVKHGCNAVRLAFSGLTQYINGTRTWNATYVQYFLDHWNGLIILDGEHIYVYQGGGPDAISQIFYDHLAEACAEEYARIAPFNGKPRVLLELVNEYDITNPGQPNDFYAVVDYMANYMRSQGIINSLGCDLPSQHSDVVKADAKLDWQGYHVYFNNWSTSTAMAWVNSALAKGIKLVMTEQGANSAEPPYTQSQVMSLNSYLDQCFKLGVSNLIWLNYGVTTNLTEYERLHLVMPKAVKPIYTVQVKSNIPVQVTVDETPDGITPADILMEEGNHTISLPQSVEI